MKQPPSLFDASMLRVELLLIEMTMLRLMEFTRGWPSLLKRAFVKKLTSWEIWQYRAYHILLKDGLQGACLAHLAKRFDRLDDLKTSQYVNVIDDRSLEDDLCDIHEGNKWWLREKDGSLIIYCRANYHVIPIEGPFYEAASQIYKCMYNRR
jgi:hypothetical protein